MAASMKRQYLTCFYCNKRSNIKYDGLIAQWQCAKCDSTNFLDKNGDITDPPVALPYDAKPAPLLIQYAAHPGSPAEYFDNNNVFCTTCVKNQHLYTSSLRQYEIDLEIYQNLDNTAYVALEEEVAKYKRGLEERYPQVCEDCEPRVLQKIKLATRNAQTDHIGRLLQKTRERRNTAQSSLFSVRSFEKIGRWSCLLGIAGQLLWHITFLLRAAQHCSSAQSVDPTLVDHILAVGATIAASTSPILLPAYRSLRSIPLISTLIPPSKLRLLPKYSLVATLPSLLWSPKFREAAYGFLTHINGYIEYYKLQSILFSIRVLFYILMNTRMFSDPYAPINIGAHSVMPCLVLVIAIKMRYCVKEEPGKLFLAPSRIAYVGPRSGSPIEKDTSVEKFRRSMTSGRPLTPPSPVHNKYNIDTFNFDQLSSIVNDRQARANRLPSPPSSYSMQNDLRQRQPRMDEAMDWTPEKPREHPSNYFQQPKLFVPETHVEGDELADLLGGFTLSQKRTDGRKDTKGGNNYLVLIMIVLLAATLCLWYFPDVFELRDMPLRPVY